MGAGVGTGSRVEVEKSGAGRNAADERGPSVALRALYSNEMFMARLCWAEPRTGRDRAFSRPEGKKRHLTQVRLLNGKEKSCSDSVFRSRLGGSGLASVPLGFLLH